MTRDADHALRRRFAYDVWANREALASLERATAPLPDRVAEILAHVLGSQRVWLSRIVPASESAAIPAVWPAFDPADTARQIDNLAAAWPAALDESPTGRPVLYTNTRGESYTSTVGDIAEHVLLHGAYHRGQIASLLGRSGLVPASTDFILWSRSEETSPG